MRIVITGSPGTGKSEIAGILSRDLGIELVDTKEIAKKNHLVNAKHEVDLKKLAKALSFLRSKKDFVAEGHLLCEVRVPCDHIFILRSDPKTLMRRFARRGYSKSKTDENIMAEMLDYCTQAASKTYGKSPLELDTSRRTARFSALLIEKAIKQRKKKLDSVDYTDALKARLGLGRLK